MSIRLYDWAPSPFCLKVRAILGYKSLDYERIDMTAQRLGEVQVRGGVGKVPAVEIDGELIVDSTDIAEALDLLQPAPPLMPASPRDRGLCAALEDWTDEALYFNFLYFHWREPAGREQTSGYFSAQTAVAPVFPLLDKRISSQLDGHGTGRKTEAMVRRDVARQLDAAEAMLSGSPFLLGERPFLCDFALMGQLVYLSRAPAGPAMLAGCANLARFLSDMRAMRPSP
jgi:glutathione S-transferase